MRSRTAHNGPYVHAGFSLPGKGPRSERVLSGIIAQLNVLLRPEHAHCAGCARCCSRISRTAAAAAAGESGAAATASRADGAVASARAGDAQSSRILASRKTLPHFASSVCTCDASRSGPPPPTSAPCCAQVARMSGMSSTLLSSPFNRETTSLGVFAGLYLIADAFNQIISKNN